jgi:pumilio family protein 6
VIETIYSEYSNAKEKYHLLQEFYHPEYRTFKTELPLSEILKKHEKKHILTNLLNVIQPCIEKGILGDFTMVQRACLDYLELASEDERAALLSSLHTEIVAILHNKEGALMSMRAISYGTAKDRKLISKGFKDFVMKMAGEEYGHWVLLQFMDTVDDTVLTSTAIFKEFKYSELAENKYFRKTVLFALLGRSSRHFAPIVLESLIQNGKKDAFRRSRELCTAVSAPLLEIVQENMIPWLKDPDMGPFTVEVMMRTCDTSSTKKEEMVKIIADALENERDGHFLRCIKSLVQYYPHWKRNQEKAKVKEGYTEEGHSQLAQELEELTNSYAEKLYSMISKDTLKSLALGEGAFVALAFCENEKTRESAVNALKSCASDIAKSEAKGCKPLLETLSR